MAWETISLSDLFGDQTHTLTFTLTSTTPKLDVRGEGHETFASFSWA